MSGILLDWNSILGHIGVYIFFILHLYKDPVEWFSFISIENRGGDELQLVIIKKTHVTKNSLLRMKLLNIDWKIYVYGSLSYKNILVIYI